MLLAHNLSGPLAGSASVENLQRSLANLAIATNRPAINPGAIDGTVGPQTMAAVHSALGILTEELPSSIYLAMQVAFVAGGNTSQAKAFVTSYASQLTIAANTAAVKYKLQPAAPMTPYMVPTAKPEQGFFASLFAPGWYKTPFGIVLIGVGVYAGYKIFIAPKALAAPAA